MKPQACEKPPFDIHDMLAAPGCEVRVFPQKEGVGFSPAFCGHVLEGGEFVTWDGSRAASSVKWILQKTPF